MMITPEDDETPFAVVEEEETIVAVMDDEEEEPEEEETIRPDPVNARQERRRQRALAGSLPKPEETLALSAPPLPDLADLPPPSLADAPLPSLPALPDLPPPSREANCASARRPSPFGTSGFDRCLARFVARTWRCEACVASLDTTAAASGSNFAQRTPPLGVPGLRQRGLGPPWRCLRRPQANRKGRRTGSNASKEDARDRRHRPHALGHTWRRHRRKRSPPPWP